MRKIRTTVHAGIYLTILVLAAAFRIAQADDRDDRSVAQAWVDAWNSHDPDAVEDLFTEDGVYEDVTLGLVNRGPAQIRGYAVFYFTAVPDFRIDLIASSFKGGHGPIEWVASGTDQGIYKTGKKFAVRGATIFDARGTKISRDSDYYDFATLLRQLGLLPPGL